MAHLHVRLAEHIQWILIPIVLPATIPATNQDIEALSHGVKSQKNCMAVYSGTALAVPFFLDIADEHYEKQMQGPHAG